MKITYGQAREAIDAFINDYSVNGVVSDSEIKKVVFSVSADIQLRDYLLGKPVDSNLADLLVLMPILIGSASKKQRPALYAIYSAYLYENGEMADAFLNLSACRQIDGNYNLAILLDNVFKANWSVQSFARMRSELHPKVIETISGVESDLVEVEDSMATA